MPPATITVICLPTGEQFSAEFTRDPPATVPSEDLEDMQIEATHLGLCTMLVVKCRRTHAYYNCFVPHGPSSSAAAWQFVETSYFPTAKLLLRKGEIQEAAWTDAPSYPWITVLDMQPHDVAPARRDHAQSLAISFARQLFAAERQ